MNTMLYVCIFAGGLSDTVVVFDGILSGYELFSRGSPVITPWVIRGMFVEQWFYDS